jgi:integrase
MSPRRAFGTIRKLQSGRWQAMYTHPETRQRITGQTTFASKADAARWLSATETETDLHRGDGLDPTDRSVTLATYADEWLATKTALRPRTQEVYAYLLRVHIAPALGHHQLNRLTGATVRGWHAELRSGSLSDASAAKAYRLLRQICQSAVDDKLMRESPCRIKGAGSDRSRQRQVPTLDEVDRLANAVEPRYRGMVLLAAHAGLRKGECFGLARRHLELAAKPPTVTVERARIETASLGLIFQGPKTVAGLRTLVLPASLVGELQHHLDRWVDVDPDALVFTAKSSRDTPTKMVWRRVWDNARAAAGVPCTFHDLRHVAGTLNAVAGATLKESMARLGHASPAAVLRYQHAASARDAEVASAVDALLQRAPSQTSHT